jgi:hypothetical protein
MFFPPLVLKEKQKTPTLSPPSSNQTSTSSLVGGGVRRTCGAFLGGKKRRGEKEPKRFKAKLPFDAHDGGRGWLEEPHVR